MSAKKNDIYLIAYHLERPFWHSTQKLFTCALKCKQRKYALGLCVWLAATLGSAPLILISYAIKWLCCRRRPLVYWAGEKKESSSGRPTVVTHLNTCMLPGALPSLFGKVSFAADRLALLFHWIKKINPDLLFLSEYSPLFALPLYDALSAHYAHFFIVSGPPLLGMPASMVVLSRLAVNNAQFVTTQASAIGRQKFYRRGYFLLETEALIYLYVHLHPATSRSADPVQASQLAEIGALINCHCSQKPWVCLGDFNIDRRAPLYSVMTTRMGWRDLVKQHCGVVATTKQGSSVDAIFTSTSAPIKTTLTVHETWSHSLPPLSDHKGLTATFTPIPFALF